MKCSIQFFFLLLFLSSLSLGSVSYAEEPIVTEASILIGNAEWAKKKIEKIFSDPRNTVGILIDSNLERYKTIDNYLTVHLNERTAAGYAIRMKFEPWRRMIIVPSPDFLPKAIRHHFESIPIDLIDPELPANVRTQISQESQFCAFTSFGLRGIGTGACLSENEADSALNLRCAFAAADAGEPSISPLEVADFQLEWQHALDRFRKTCPNTLSNLTDVDQCRTVGIPVLNRLVYLSENLLLPAVVDESYPQRKRIEMIELLRLLHYVYSAAEDVGNTLFSAIRIYEDRWRVVPDPVFEWARERRIAFQVDYVYETIPRQLNSSDSSERLSLGSLSKEDRNLFLRFINDMLIKQMNSFGLTIPVLRKRYDHWRKSN